MRSIAIATIVCAVAMTIVTGISRASAGAPRLQPTASAACSPALPHASGTTAETIATSDGPRGYRLHVPPSYSGGSAVPLVFDIHGATSNATDQEFYSGFSTKADAAGFIVVYPEGVTTAGIPYTHFNAWQFGSPEPNDVGFITTLLDALELQLCIESSRVFSTGMSNGAIMSVRLACSLSSRIAAVAPVAGAYYPPAFVNVPSETCPDTTPVPMIAFHGTADTSVPFNGGLGGMSGTTNFRLPIDDNTPAEDVLSDWSAHNTCTSARQESQVSSEVRLIQYDACAGDAIVQLYAVDGGGHTWPGAIDVPRLGYTTHQINATDLIWSFFSAHPLTTPSSVGGIAEPPDETVLPTTVDASDNHAPAFAIAATLAAIAAIGPVAWYTHRRPR